MTLLSAVGPTSYEVAVETLEKVGPKKRETVH